MKQWSQRRRAAAAAADVVRVWRRLKQRYTSRVQLLLLLLLLLQCLRPHLGFQAMVFVGGQRAVEPSFELAMLAAAPGGNGIGHKP